MTESRNAARGRGRRPAAEVRSEVLAAAAGVLLAEGIAAVTFERVAQESGASKTTLYKWWPSPGALAAESFFVHSEPRFEFPDTGDLRADLLTQLRAFVELWTLDGAGESISQLIGTAQLDPEVSRAWSRSYALPRRELARTRLRAAQHQGEIAAHADIDIMIDQLWGACYHRVLVLRVPLEDLNLERLVDHALHGATLVGPASASAASEE